MWPPAPRGRARPAPQLPDKGPLWRAEARRLHAADRRFAQKGPTWPSEKVNSWPGVWIESIPSSALTLAGNWKSLEKGGLTATGNINKKVLPPSVKWKLAQVENGKCGKDLHNIQEIFVYWNK